MIIIFALIAFQFVLLWWKKHHYRSYQATTTIGLWYVPCFYSSIEQKIESTSWWNIPDCLTSLPSLRVYLSAPCVLAIIFYSYRIIPFALALQSGMRQFAIVWVLFTILNSWIIYKATRKPLHHMTPKYDLPLQHFSMQLDFF